MPQAVSSLPSIAKSIGPVTRRLPLLSSNFGSSGVSGRLMSAVAFAIFTFATLSGASAGAASTRNSVSAPVPLIDRPGPPSAGSDRSAAPDARP